MPVTRTELILCKIITLPGNDEEFSFLNNIIIMSNQICKCVKINFIKTKCNLSHSSLSYYNF